MPNLWEVKKKRVIIKMAVIFYNMSKLASGIPNIILSNFILTTTQWKNFCYFPILKMRKSSLREIKGVNCKGNQSWIFIGRTDAEAEAPVFWPPDAKNWLIGKDPNAGKDWRLEEKGMTENVTVGWPHQLNGQEFEQTPRDSEGQGSILCCSSWRCKESDTT